MNRFTLFLRKMMYLTRRKNLKVHRFILLAVVLLTIVLIGVQEASDYMEVDILPDAMNYNNYLPSSQSGAHEEHFFDKEKLTEMMSYTMQKIRAHSSSATVDRKRSEKCNLGDVGIDSEENFHKLTKQELLKCIDVPQTAFEQLQESHKKFVDSLVDEILDEYPTDLYGGKGIVIVAGGKYTLFAMPAIKAIRMNGDPTIPIEVMIPPEMNGEDAFCENILPLLDPSGLSRCVYMAEVFDKQTLEDVQGYQLKALALLASSFEKVLLLDADNYVVNSISSIFEVVVFQEFGLVLWPDYWRRLHHPKLYEIVGISVDEKKKARYSVDDVTPTEMFEEKDVSKIPFHDLEGAIPDGGTESGQLLVDKSKHLGTIILSLYYNYNGPSQYYPLLGQGFAGEGDKDTFALAANTLTQRGIVSEYHQVKTPVSASGHWVNSKDESLITDKEGVPNEKKSFRGVAMLQHDLLQDFEAYMAAVHDLHDSFSEDFTLYYTRMASQRPPEGDDSESVKKIAEWEKKVHEDFWKTHKVNYSLKTFLSYFKEIPVTFVHSHLPKYDPWSMSLSGDLTFDGKKVLEKHKDEPDFSPLNRGHYRMYDKNFSEKTNYDLELANFITFRDFICKIEGGYKNFSYLLKEVGRVEKGMEMYKSMCDYINNRIDMLASTTWSGSVY
ncbi:uncharacterized protein ZBIST_1758 [Zygosaccharomyces bailii]|nr:uncharacterized protein ZBIST_1758 [Zygosaccharomyces bailii]